MRDQAALTLKEIAVFLMSVVLLTGVAGFVGMHTAERLLSDGHQVIGVDNVNDYYSLSLKRGRLERLAKHDGFLFHEIDIADYEALTAAQGAVDCDAIIHLAAQAGVRYSLQNPFAYASSKAFIFNRATVTSEVQYQLAEIASGEVVFIETIEAVGEASFKDSLVQPTRIGLAIGYSQAENTTMLC